MSCLIKTLGFTLSCMHSMKTQISRAQERAMTRKAVLQKAISGELSWVQVAEILRLTGRQVRRIRARYELYGESGLLDRRIGRINSRRIPEREKQKVCELYRERYYDFSAMHFYEKLISVHKNQVASYSKVLAWLQEEGLLAKHSRHASHRKKRERRPMSGMLLHLDGSTHAWLGEHHPNFDLLAVVDDATSEVYSARFVSQEGTRTCMQVIRETVEKMGTFCSLYTDRAMHFVVTMKAGDKPDRNRTTHLSRALDRLGTELIHAYSPQARGRSERLWKTWQGRLPQELRVAEIKTMEEANRYLREIFVPWHNQSLTVKALEPESSAFIPVPLSLNLNHVFSLQAFRQVNADNTIQFKNKLLQIPKQTHLRFSFAGVKVTVHEHLDCTFSITYGPHLLGVYSAEGKLIKFLEVPKKKAA